MRAEAISEHRSERAAARAPAPRAEPAASRAAAPAPVRGTHDVAELPVHAPREVALWRRTGAVAAPGPAGAGRRRRRVVQAKLRVGRPGDAYERDADAVAARVIGARPTRPRERGHGPAPRQAPRALRRAQAHARAPPRTRGPPPTSTVPDRVEAVIAAPSSGRPLDPDVRARIEPHVGADLASVRIRDGPDADAAARALGARAFAADGAIFLAAGESPRDVALIAHEAAHVAQQDASPSARGRVMRQVAEGEEEPGILDAISDAALDLIRSGVRAIPGYQVLCTIAGVDLLTGRPALVSREQLLELVLSWGPFGAAVGPVLRTIGVVEDVFAVVSDGLTAHDLTLARLEREVAAGWAELSIVAGYEANLAVVRRRIDGLLRDVAAFVGAIAEQVLALVRRAVAAVAAPLLEQPPIAPVWSLARKVLHYDPLLGQHVDASTVEILSDFLRLIGKEAALEQMTQRGTLQATADWIDTQLETFSGLLTDLGTLFSDAWAAIQPANLPQILDTLPQLASRAFGLLGRISDFAQTVVTKVLELIKDALLGWLSEYAHRIPGFHLLTVILERNPFTGEDVPRTAENLIKGFVTLLPNGEATYEQLAQSGVVAEAATRIESAIATLGISWQLITGTFRGIWESLSLEDLLDPISAFVRVVERFGEPVARIVAFVGVVIETVISLVLRLMNFPTDLLMNIIANVQRALADIERDPIAFLLNLLEALKAGFLGFFDRIGGYLLEGLTAWLFRGLGQLGIQIPTDLSLPSILGLVLQVLGLSMETIWTKLGEHLGPERVAMIRGALDMLSGAWAFIVDVQERGLVAIWEYVSQQLSSLWDTLLGMATEWIMTTIVNNVIARLISMLDPTGVMAVVNSFIAFFRAVQSAIEYLREILQIVDMYVSTVAAIAAGNIQPGAEMVERGLAAAIPIAIGFLATQVGIADIPEKIVELIGRLRELVDQAIDWLIEQAIRLGQGVLSALGLGGGEEPGAAAAAGPGAVEFDAGNEHHRLWITEGASPDVMVASGTPQLLSAFITRVDQGIQKLPAADPNRATLAAALAQVQADFAGLAPELQAATVQTGSRISAERLQRLANRLQNLMALEDGAAHAGTASDPIPITWYKPPSVYQTLSLQRGEVSKSASPTSGTWLEPPPRLQATLDTSGGKVKIGVASAYMAREGKRVRKVEAGGAQIGRVTGAVADFNEVMAYWGLAVGASSLNTDHVTDIAFAGPDDFPNLWPIDAGANNRANEVYRQLVWYEGPGGVEAKSVQDLEDKVFEIARIQ
jgi:hypothetical protein